MMGWRETAAPVGFKTFRHFPKPYLRLNAVFIKREISPKEARILFPASPGVKVSALHRDSPVPLRERALETRICCGNSHYLLPFARLCVLHNISQFSIVVAPPLLHAVTWSASISLNL